MKKKALSLLLALVLCLGLAIPTLAAGETSVTDGAGITYSLSNPVISIEQFDTHNPYAPNGGIITVYVVPMDTVITPSHNEDYFLLNWYEDGDYGGWEGSATVFNGGVRLDSEDIILFYNWSGDTRYDTHFRAASTSSTPETPAAPIAEVPSQWATEQVNAALDAGIVPEALQSKFTTATTRAEFCDLAVALYETVKGAEITERAQFDDTTDVNIEKMAALGVVNGVGGGKFSPDSSLTREQAATMLSRLANAIGKPLPTTDAPPFVDNASISPWALDAVGQMQATGIMGGVGDNTFAPKSDYTREQSIVTMMRLFDIVK